jgi:hypothetical protein
MSNSSRIEVATRQHVNAVLTSEQIVELVKVSDPTSTKGVYPSDCAGKRLEDGTLTFRGKVAYGNLVLEYMGPNSFKVLPTEQIVRKPTNKKTKTVIPVAAPVIAAAAPVVAAPVVAAAVNGNKKKSSGKASRLPVAPKSTKRVAQLQ